LADLQRTVYPHKGTVTAAAICHINKVFVLLMWHRWLDSGKDDGKIERCLVAVEHIPAASSPPSPVPPLDGMNQYVLSL